MYERKNEEVLPTRLFLWRMLRHFGIAGLIVIMALCLGVIGHMWFEQVSWHDATLNVTFILAGLGPFLVPATVAGKLFFAFYSLVVSVLFVAIIGVVMAPVVHRIIHKFHLDGD